MFCDVIIVAGGSSRRFGLDIPKQFQTIAGKPLYLWSVELFLNWKTLGELVLVVPEDWVRPVEDSFKLLIENKKIHIVSGGSSRQSSTHKGLKHLEKISNNNWVAIHDAARPCVTEPLLEVLWGEVKRNSENDEFGGVVPATNVSETIKVITGNVIKETLNRDQLKAVQTPQILRTSVLKEAMNYHTDFAAFDDSSLVEKMGRKVVVCEGGHDNLKVTHQEDMERVQNWLRKRHPQI